MRIMEIIVDGFKSYAQRTVIGRFDPKFNAITGLNGSGKSNILDSICFVVRAGTTGTPSEVCGDQSWNGGRVGNRGAFAARAGR
jgi:AAA15 family ATPase/GTPase